LLVDAFRSFLRFGSLWRSHRDGDMLPSRPKGQKDGHAVLDTKVCASFFLCERIYGTVSAASKPPAQPKWSHPRLE
jgi:hypothetical protein